mmetsp:Transcript_30395/g.90667  ORF Transcript_30395/g.90667 Transcript_30395/m.90667 type:complete len:91 (-) Transcript_30395:370-642(-)
MVHLPDVLTSYPQAHRCPHEGAGPCSSAAPLPPPTPESCEGKCSGQAPYFGCSWWSVNGSVKNKCNPNGGGGCQYLQEGEDSSWCTYLTF